MLAPLLAALAAVLPAPAVTAAPVQDSPVHIDISLRGGERRAQCSVDGARPAGCRLQARFALRPGRHLVAVRGINRRGRTSAARTVAVVVASPAPSAVDVGGEPVGIAAGAGSLWISGGSSGQVARVDPATGQVTARIQAGGQLGSVFAGGNGVWVGDFGGGGVVRIDPASNAVVARVQVGGRPTGIAADASGRLWVANLGGSLARIDPATDTQLAAVAFKPAGSCVLFAAGGLWVGTQDGSLAELDPVTGDVLGSVAIAPDVDAIAETPEGLWVTTFDGHAALVDPASRRILHRADLPGEGSGISYAGGSVYASVYDRDLVVRLDPRTGAVTGAFDTGAQPREQVVVGSTLWVADGAAGEVTPIPLG